MLRMKHLLVQELDWLKRISWAISSHKQLGGYRGMRYELRELEERILKTSRDFAARHPMSVSDAVLSARAEEDDEL